MKRLFFALLSCLIAGAAYADDDTAAVRPINLDKLNTPRNETDPHITSNGLALYYSSNATGKFDILLSKRSTLTTPWLPGKPLGDYIQTQVDDRSVFATPEGRFPQFLYFATKKDKEINNFDIYAAVRQGPNKAFSAPTPLNTICTETDELYPWLTADGKSLYFSRKTNEGWQAFVTTRTTASGAAGFGQPKPVPGLPSDFHHVTLTPDGKTMYLQGRLDSGLWGLFRSSAGAKGWSKPEPLDMLNSPDATTGDQAPCLSRDGTLLYFASDRPGGKGGLDLWYVPVSQLTNKK